MAYAARTRMVFPKSQRMRDLDVDGTANVEALKVGGVTSLGGTPPAFTQTYSTASTTIAALTVGSDIGAFTDPPSAAEMSALRTFVNALKADVLDIKKNTNALVDLAQADGRAT